MRNRSLSQFPRCCGVGANISAACQPNSCHPTPINQISYMGYSLRVDKVRTALTCRWLWRLALAAGSGSGSPLAQAQAPALKLD